MSIRHHPPHALASMKKRMRAAKNTHAHGRSRMPLAKLICECQKQTVLFFCACVLSATWLQLGWWPRSWTCSGGCHESLSRPAHSRKFVAGHRWPLRRPPRMASRPGVRHLAGPEARVKAVLLLGCVAPLGSWRGACMWLSPAPSLPAWCLTYCQKKKIK